MSGDGLDPVSSIKIYRQTSSGPVTGPLGICSFGIFVDCTKCDQT